MGESGDPVTAAAEALAKQLPVKQLYNEALSPAAKEAGQFFGDIAKTIRLALVPFQLTAAYQDRLTRFIDRAVRRVPEEKRIAPAPQILGPTLEGIRYEVAESPIDEMFSELLSRSMDTGRADEAHPAYPHIIRQLSSDEAKILVLLRDCTYRYVYTRDYDGDRALFVGPHKIETDALPRQGLMFPDNVNFYMDHLDQLGLAGVYQEGNQDPIHEPDGKQIGVRVTCNYRLKEFGRRFVAACIA
jgi:abortive infection alpha-like protein